MRTGIGWRHPHYREVLQHQPPVAFLEVHSENFFGEGGAALQVLEQGRALYPVSLHGVGLSLGSAIGIDSRHLEQLHRLVQRTQPLRVSDHASFSLGLAGAGSAPKTVHAADLLPVQFSKEALDTMAANLHRVQDRLGRTLAIENISAYIGWPDRSMDEPSFLCALVQRTGCSLLVDLNNLYVNALNQQLRSSDTDVLQVCRAWLDAIPAAAVAELHLAGHSHGGDLVIDDHGSRVCEEVWGLYQHAIHRFGDVPTLIEWDSDIPSLDVLLQEMRRADAVPVGALP